jgi:hypothetical protein
MIDTGSSEFRTGREIKCAASGAILPESETESIGSKCRPQGIELGYVICPLLGSVREGDVYYGIVSSLHICI